MNCPRCGTPAAQGANFCARCGAPLAVFPPREGQAAFPHPPVPVPPTYGPLPPKRKDGVAIGMMALALAIVLFLGLAATGILRVGAREDRGPVVVLPNRQEPKAILQDPGERVAMPKHIRDWLEHLQRIEERKNRLAAKQIAQSTMFMAQHGLMKQALDQLADPGLDDGAEPDPNDTAQGALRSMVPEWKSLVQDYQALPPPAECQALADEYYQALNEIPAWVGDLESALQQAITPSGESTDGAQKGLEQLMNMQGTSAGSIDEHFMQAEERLGQLCRAYNTRQWFSIRSDVGGGLVSKLGF